MTLLAANYQISDTSNNCKRKNTIHNINGIKNCILAMLSLFYQLSFYSQTEYKFISDRCDYFLTNIPERASRPEHGDILQPYQVKEGLNGLGRQIELSNCVTVLTTA